MKNCFSALSEIDHLLNKAKRILIATDFDGTLCRIAPTPWEVDVAPPTLEVLRCLAATPRVTLAVISGRALADVRSRVPLDVVFSGNHGLEIAGRGLFFDHAEARALRPTLTAACDGLKDAMSPWPVAWIEDKGLSATLHFRGVEERHHYCLISAARRCLAAFGPTLAFRVGKRALDVRPRVGWDKGSALTYIRKHLGPFDACVAIGDDRTDEMMFRANSNGVNIRVGSAKPTDATHCLSDTAEVAIFLSHIADLCNTEPALESFQLATI